MELPAPVCASCVWCVRIALWCVALVAGGGGQLTCCLRNAVSQAYIAGCPVGNCTADAMFPSPLRADALLQIDTSDSYDLYQAGCMRSVGQDCVFYIGVFVSTSFRFSVQTLNLTSVLVHWRRVATRPQTSPLPLQRRRRQASSQTAVWSRAGCAPCQCRPIHRMGARGSCS